MYKVFEFIINSIDNNLQVVDGCQYFGEKSVMLLLYRRLKMLNTGVIATL
jgi:hypothetical protein